MNFGLKNKTAIVLASSKGLGKASALALSQEGANLVIASRNESEINETAEEISKQTKNKVLPVVCDVTNLRDIEMLIEKTVQEFGNIDILVNNAGGPPVGTFDDIDDEKWENAFNLTLMSAIRTIRLVLPYMKKQKSGRIINMTSLSVKQPLPNLILSNSIRSSVVAMAKTLSNQVAKYNITVNNILTGHFQTDRLRELYKIDEKIQQGLTEDEAWENVLREIPMNRLGKLEEYGGLVAFLASKQAAYITGVSIQIDGGLNKSIL